MNKRTQEGDGIAVQIQKTYIRKRKSKKILTRAFELVRENLQESREEKKKNL